MSWSLCLRGGLLLVLLTGCAASEDAIQEEFRAYVAGANSCTAVSECTVVSPGCPLGCSTAVGVDRKADVEKKARDLIDRYERFGSGCVYDCASVGPLVCEAGRCAFASLEADAGADR